jgi:two-component system, cell cycle sensor histidine kinase and response regulator CckA
MGIGRVTAGTALDTMPAEGSGSRPQPPTNIVASGPDDVGLAEAALEASAIGLMVYGVDLRYRLWNPAMEVLTGLPAGKVLGRLPMELFPGHPGGSISRKVTRCLSTGETLQHEFEFALAETGKRGWVIGTYSPMRGPEGEILGVVDTVRDISDRHEAEERLRASERELAGIFESLGDAVAVHEPGGRFLQVNQVFCDRLGYTRDELLRMTVTEVNVPERRLLVPERIQQTLTSGGSVFEAVQLARDGRHIPVEISARLITFRGSPAIIAVHRDLRERMEAAAALASSELRLRTAMDSMLEGVGVLSAIRRGDGRIVDFRIDYANHALGAISGLPAEQQIGRTLLELFPAHGTNGMFEQHVRVVETGIPLESTSLHFVDLHARGGPLDQILDQRVAKLGDGYILSVRDVTQRWRADESLRRSEERFRGLFDLARDPILIRDLRGLFLELNGAACRHLGYTRDELLEMTVADIDAVDNPPNVGADRMREILENGSAFFETAHRRRDGTVVPVEVSASVLQLSGGMVILSIVRDISERKRAEAERAALEDQLRQSQKMEGIGRLAGGIAHDFNNLLTAIRGNASLALADMPPGEGPREDIEQIEIAADRAAALTRQLLAFARQTVIHRQPVDLVSIVCRMEPMLRRLIGEHIDLVTDTSSRITVMADPSQIEQVVLNLVVNACDAMPEGGRLTIRTAVADGPEGARLAVLAVVDTGIGMDERVRARVFEPFFTTKEPGKGTGLGLATVYGIVRQSGGSIDVASQPGHGATFTVRLPALDEPGPDDADLVATSERGGGETILLVEDDDAVRRFATLVLESGGHRVLAFGQGTSAVEAAEREPIGLLLTDMRMPGMTGREVAGAVARIRPEAPILFVSGHTDEPVIRDGNLQPGHQFLAKPFTGPELLAAVERALRGAA